MEPLLIGGLVVVAALMGIGGTYLVVRRSPPVTVREPAPPDPEVMRRAEARGEELVEQSRRDAERIVREAELKARDEAVRRREELSRELDTARSEVRDLERRVEKREDAVEQHQRELARKEKYVDGLKEKIAEREDALDKKAHHLDGLIDKQTKQLHELSGLSREDAQKLLLERLERELSDEIAKKIRQHDERMKQQAEATAREIVTIAIQRYAAHQTAGATVSTVDIPSDDMKGRIIGREGRNIRTFEKLTGVDVIVDDTPGVVIVSAFDNVRRETARIALTKLIQDGRIHPTRIEEVVAETQAEMEKHIQELGTQAVLDADVQMPHEKLVYLLGRLRFRTSYSQNVLAHSVEVAHLCGIMASELGLSPAIARRCGLLHDVGKAADHEMEGGHPKVGAELAKRYGETSKEVLHAIAGHHDDITIDNIYTVLVASADAISASRPGARRETLEKYVKRLADLEAVACGFPEVDQAFAIQAGRELRVIANAQRTNDADAVRICRDIARSIEQQLDYPGEIKVTVIRESRATDTAK
ncbi:Ribonuclease Y [Gemmata sp. SH-PL17]|uniref:ribonuclease Y n=1 Tax=Gemmata sp. SH-PL17 TaxID=1630693 RepID=UPI00078B7386|nr:ribonuclease Y [Gemmata sp. SH-PL17]AMV26840.1 Ribonuclease Y [Gemmata sp. SH-PL17]